MGGWTIFFIVWVFSGVIATLHVYLARRKCRYSYDEDMYWVSIFVGPITLGIIMFEIFRDLLNSPKGNK